MAAIVGIRYRNYAHYTLCRSCLPLNEIAITRSLSFLFLDGFEGNANISVAIKSCSTVFEFSAALYHLVSLTKTSLFSSKLPAIAVGMYMLLKVHSVHN